MYKPARYSRPSAPLLIRTRTLGPRLEAPMQQQQYPTRSKLVQALCPAPKRLLQQLIIELGCRTGLDVGCGAGSPLTGVRSPSFRSTGIDADPVALERSRENGVHDSYIQANFLEHDFKEHFDVVVMSHVLEHFSRDAGVDVLRRLEGLARTLLYVEVPYGFIEQFAVEGNPHQRHLSGWFPEDFEGRGYTCFGSGARMLRAHPRRRPMLPNLVRRNLLRAVQWFVFQRPRFGDAIAAIRLVDGDGNLRQI